MFNMLFFRDKITNSLAAGKYDINTTKLLLLNHKSHTHSACHGHDVIFRHTRYVFSGECDDNDAL